MACALKAVGSFLSMTALPPVKPFDAMALTVPSGLPWRVATVPETWIVVRGATYAEETESLAGSGLGTGAGLGAPASMKYVRAVPLLQVTVTGYVPGRFTVCAEAVKASGLALEIRAGAAKPGEVMAITVGNRACQSVGMAHVPEMLTCSPPATTRGPTVTWAGSTLEFTEPGSGGVVDGEAASAHAEPVPNASVPAANTAAALTAEMRMEDLPASVSCPPVDLSTRGPERRHPRPA
ncbi:hypothetical protein SSP24_80210 [Streptomyces spinoverrucosus]|uniref:Uncharacterized protein n=1 Tax=Streptomyces spinoverrucosus TaxID=284043 RepID=A0A4Y3VZ94_9ACTN|nr:hypothetical protein [Streptomyces spinoverrucosus]GEC10366.1 hypothetical protein SSP24_80210 [Streptomyces spinoverrucosus]GHB98463.1 hypothetical protein GCM10010397_83630 [Streptomyces spinoverrucosus]